MSLMGENENRRMSGLILLLKSEYARLLMRIDSLEIVSKRQNLPQWWKR